MDDFKKKLEYLAQNKVLINQRNNQIQRELIQNLKSREDDMKGQFVIVKKTVTKLVEQTNEAFAIAGESFNYYDNEAATALDDQIKMFCQVFYYPKGRSEKEVGFNTASIKFDCEPFYERITIYQNIELRPAPLKQFEVVPLAGMNEEKIKMLIENFIESVIAKK